MKPMTKAAFLTLAFCSTVAGAASAEYKDCQDKSDEDSCLSFKVTIPDYSYPGLNAFALSDTFGQADLHLANLQAITTAYVKNKIKDDAGNQTEVTWHPAEEAGDYVQISRDESLYPQGAAHGLFTTNYYVFAKNHPDKPVLLSDILVSEDSQAKLSEMLKSLYLIWQVNTGSSEAEAKDILDSFLEDGKMPVSNNWYFAREMIVFNYPPYEIGPYSYGSINLATPVNGLGGIIKDEILTAADKCAVPFNTQRY